MRRLSGRMAAGGVKTAHLVCFWQSMAKSNHGPLVVYLWCDYCHCFELYVVVCLLQMNLAGRVLLRKQAWLASVPPSQT